LVAVKPGDLMSNDVQTHETADERVAGEERRASPRHAAASLGSVTARIIGGSPVELVNFSSRGVLFECDSRLLIGARASVRITTTESNLIVTGRVVRSRVKGLVNGSLRYDAALFLDTDLALAPKLPVAAAPDPAAVDAYLAASEASLAEVAGAVEPIDAETAEAIAAIDAAVAEVEAAPFQVETAPEFETAAAFEAAPEFEAVAEFEIAPEFEAVAEFEVAPELEAPGALEAVAAVDAVPEPPPLVVVGNAVVMDPEPPAGVVADDESVAFEADADIAFEPSSEFVFEDAAPTEVAALESAAVGVEPVVEAAPSDEIQVSPRMVEEEPAGTSMFDSTYVAPVVDTPSTETMFMVTPPTPVVRAPVSSMFDSRPSESYGEAPRPSEATGPVEAVVDGDGDIAFEAEDAVMFEAAFDEPVAEAVPPLAVEPPPLPAVEAEPVLEARPVVEAEPVVEVAEDVATVTDDVLVEVNVVLEPVAEEPADLPVAAARADDRVLAQFAATVPQDLAELQRIAADNQW
jgi:hypothetical protein